jgi:predicted nuclease of predicted toxin-antitoxin system
LKLLLDQNISHRLLPFLITRFPDSTHVRTAGLATASDSEIWTYAREHQYVIVTRDVDFLDNFLVRGAPPYVVWLNCGNSSTGAIAAILLRHVDSILALDEAVGCLTLT